MGEIRTVKSLVAWMHIYRNKSECIFKAIAFTISWSGGVYVSGFSPNSFTRAGFGNVFVFSIALIMEFALPLVRAKRFAGRVIPFLIFVGSALGLVVSTTFLLGKTLSDIWIKMAYYGPALSLPLLWFDAFTHVLIDSPNDVCVEEKLKGIVVNDI